MILDLIEALIIGVLAGVTILYTFQTRIPYPEWMLQTFEHPWIFVCAFIATILFANSSPRIAAMIILLLIALWFDWVIFANNHDEPKKKSGKTINPEISPGKKLVAEVYPYTEPSNNRKEDNVIKSTDITQSDNLVVDSIPFIDIEYPKYNNMNDYVYGPALF